jgi:hypothetical protein
MQPFVHPFILLPCIVRLTLGAQPPIFAPTSNNHPSNSPTDSVASQTSAPASISVRVQSRVEWDFECSPDTSLIEVAKVIEESIRDGLEQKVHGLNRVFVYELCSRAATNPTTEIGFNTIISSCAGYEAAATIEIRTALESIIGNGILASSIARASNGEIQTIISAGVKSTYEVIAGSQAGPPSESSRSPSIQSNSITQSPSTAQTPLTPATTPSPEASDEVVAKSPYYPDWLGDDTCVNDGSAPDYMVNNPTTWLHDTLESCCSKNYSWKLAECKNGGTTLLSGSGSKLYYPDWYGDNLGCISDENAPDWVIANPSYYMSDKLEVCCNNFYQWNYNFCAGVIVGTGKWYMKYSTGKCVKDCEGGTDCGGNAEAWDNLWDSKLTCCLKQKWWDVLNC